jgi:hypothetical protein
MSFIIPFWQPVDPTSGCWAPYPETAAEKEEAKPPVLEKVYIYSTHIELPAAAKAVFDNFGLYITLCDFCRCMKNVVVEQDGKVSRVFCDSCRSVISNHSSSECSGGCSECKRSRFVDPVGTVADFCAPCHKSRRNGNSKANAKSTGKKPSAGSLKSAARTAGRRGRAPALKT